MEAFVPELYEERAARERTEREAVKYLCAKRRSFWLGAFAGFLVRCLIVGILLAAWLLTLAPE